MVLLFSLYPPGDFQDVVNFPQISGNFCIFSLPLRLSGLMHVRQKKPKKNLTGFRKMQHLTVVYDSIVGKNAGRYKFLWNQIAKCGSWTPRSLGFKCFENMSASYECCLLNGVWFTYIMEIDILCSFVAGCFMILLHLRSSFCYLLLWCCNGFMHCVFFCGGVGFCIGCRGFLGK